jgi:hypothetical protein
MSRFNLFLVSLVSLIAAGIFGLKFVEPTATWPDAARWTIMAFATFGVDMFPPTNSSSSWFQAIFLLASFVQTGFLLTIVIPLFSEWWEAPKKGLAEAKHRQGVPLYLLVGPVDWEKVESVFREMQQTLGHVHLVVVVSETLTEIPVHLQKLGIQFVNGSLRRIETYQRAGLKHATGAFVCSASYNTPDADINTAAIVSLVERFRSAVHTVAEMVSRDNADLFSGTHGVNESVTFDPLTLAAVARMVAERLQGRAAKIVANTIDEAQRAELDRQLAAAGVVQSEDGVAARIILPDDLDNPSGTAEHPIGSDVKVWAALMRATEEVVVVMYCSIVSDDMFSGHSNVVCADRIMAQELVKALLKALAHQDS